MTLLDAQAVMAGIGGEPAAPDVERILREEDPRISAVNLAEVVDRLARRVRAPWPEIADRLEHLRVGGLGVVPADEEIALFAGEIRARHYRRSSTPVSLADCFALATSMTVSRDLATSDPALTKLCRELDTPVVPLRDSEGRRP